MAKQLPQNKKKAPTQRVSEPTKRIPVQNTIARQKTTQVFLARYIDVVFPACIAIITFLFLKICLDDQFTNWDDPGYILNDSLIKDVSSQGIKSIFSSAVMGNYHPLTILSYAIEYNYVHLSPMLYHLDSLLLHIITTILVYWFTKLLTRSSVAACITALLFGLHPMHVESVAWIAARKDVLYGAFFIGACICYVYYIRVQAAKRWLYYTGVILLFICALLSKPVAVSLPVTLLLIDYLDKRKWSVSILLDKLPHFALAIYFGFRSIADQKAFHALFTQDVHYGPVDRVLLGAYALITYLWKAIVPANLSNFYPYPDKVGNSLPGIFYIYPLLVIGIILLIVWAFVKKNRAVVFGILFFLVNIALLLQFIPVGGAIIADRYAYIPYFGLFFIVGWLVSKYLQHDEDKKIGYTLLTLSLAGCAIFGFISNERCTAWYDASSLWRDEIEKHPATAPNAYNNLGFEYFKKYSAATDKNERKAYYDSSFYLLNKAIELQKKFVNPYVSLGELERTNGQLDDAKKMYYSALKIDSAFPEAYMGIAIVFAIQNKLDSAAYCFKKTIALKPDWSEAHSNYGNYLDMIGKKDSAIIEYGISIAQNPDLYQGYLNRGNAYLRAGQFDNAHRDFNKAIELDADAGELYYARALYYKAIGDMAHAQSDLQKSTQLGYKIQ